MAMLFLFLAAGRLDAQVTDYVADSSALLGNIREKLSSRKLTREISNLIIDEDAPDDSQIRSRLNSVINATYSHTGRTISQINIVLLDPFGTSVWDTTHYNNNALNSLLNRLHFDTRAAYVRRFLLFKEGDSVDPTQIEYSERALRSAHFVSDVLITTEPDPSNASSVRVNVIVRENFGLDPVISIKGRNDGYAGLGTSSFLGTGLKMRHVVHWNLDRDQKIGYEGNLHYDRLWKVDLDISYKNTYTGNVTTIAAGKDFYSPTVRNAGAVTLSTGTARKDYILASDYRYKSGFTSVDLWYGHSIPLSDEAASHFRSNVAFMADLFIRDVRSRDKTVYDFYDFHSKSRLLSKISYSGQKLNYTSKVYNFGRTEAIPSGFKTDVTGGVERLSGEYRGYLAGGVSFGFYTSQGFYFANHASYGGYLDDEHKQKVLNIHFNSFSPLYELSPKGFSLRAFLNASYVEGKDMYDDEYLSLQSDFLSTKHFSSDSIYGSRRLTLDLETSVFTPWKPFGFNTVLFASGNLSWIDFNGASLFSSDLYSSISLGIRMRNEMLVINTIQLKLSFYPQIPNGMHPHYIRFNGEPYYKVEDMLPNRPGRVTYR